MSENRKKNKDFFPCDHLELLRGGKPYFDRLLYLISEAEKTIHFQVYLFDYDITGGKVLDALFLAAERGVKVYLILDAFGSGNLPKKQIEKLRHSNINFRIFGPLLTFKRHNLGRRLHHKVFVADSFKSLVSGINIADKYNELSGQKPWLDFALYVEDDGVSRELENVCLDIWGKDYVQLKSKKNAAKLRKNPANSEYFVKINTQDWLRRRVGIGKSYKVAFENAQNEITILGSYFMPSRRIRKRLKEASERGVDVKVILSKNSDIPFAGEATRFLYDWMFRYNIRVFEWGDSVLHGKVATVDENWSTVGSYNLNFLSDYESIELNLEVLSEKLRDSLKNELVNIIKEGCDEVKPGDFERRYHVFRRLTGWFSYVLLRYFIRFLLLFSRREFR